MSQYTYISSTDFISNLNFDYVETYSFQRGTDFEENKKLAQIEYENLKSSKKKSNNLTISEEQRFTELDALLGYTQYLLNDKGQFHPSSKKTNTFKAGDPVIDRIKSILLTQIVETPKKLCAPNYRDAIVFYTGDNIIVTALNICLSCEYMETKMFNHVNGDYKTYDLLKRFFLDIGHKVENPEYSTFDELNKLKAKFKK